MAKFSIDKRTQTFLGVLFIVGIVLIVLASVLFTPGSALFLVLIIGGSLLVVPGFIYGLLYLISLLKAPVKLSKESEDEIVDAERSSCKQFDLQTSQLDDQAIDKVKKSKESMPLPNLEEFFKAAKNVIATHDEFFSGYVFDYFKRFHEFRNCICISVCENKDLRSGAPILPDCSDDKIYSIKFEKTKAEGRFFMLNVFCYFGVVAEKICVIDNIATKIVCKNCFSPGRWSLFSPKQQPPVVFFTKEIMKAVLYIHNQYKENRLNVAPKSSFN